eukprot:m.8800 g.8800  ORF g.8800 m.8800 type:complete len:1905 (-) comp5537_c0_seq1:250-5964(-)
MVGLPALTSEQRHAAERGDRPLEIIQWLQMLSDSLHSAQKDQIKSGQKQVLEILVFLLSTPYGKPVRDQVAMAFGSLFDTAGTAQLSATIAEFHRILKSKEDGAASMQAKLGCVSTLGRLHQRLGGMMSPFVQESVVAILRIGKALGVDGRIEMLSALQLIVGHTGAMVGPAMKDIYKQAKSHAVDKSLRVRMAAAALLREMSNQTSLVQQTDLEGCVTSLCRGFENSTHVARICIAESIAIICAKTQQAETWQGTKPSKFMTMEGILALLDTIFAKFSNVPEARVGITEAYVLFFHTMGPLWLEHNTAAIVSALLHIVSNPKVVPTPTEALRVRRCVQFIIRTSLGKRLGHKGRTDTVIALCGMVASNMKVIDKPEGVDFPSTCRIITGLDAMSDLIDIIGNSINKVADQLLPVILSVALHPATNVRIAAARCLRGLVEAVPSRAADITAQCLSRLATFRSSPAGLHGTAAALAATLAGCGSGALGVPQHLINKVVTAGKDLIELSSQRKADPTAFLLMKSGWLLLTSLVSMGAATLAHHHSTYLDLWANVIKPLDKTVKLSIAAWELKLESMVGALSCITLYLQHCRSMITEDGQRQIVSLIIKAMKVIPHLPPYTKNAEAFTDTKALFRRRVYTCLALVPPSLFEEKFGRLVPLLVADIALSDHVSLTHMTSVLQHQCHEEDSVLLGTTRESDYATVEEQLDSLGRAGLGAVDKDAFYLLEPSLLTEPQLPLDPQVEVLDAAVVLFGKVFPLLPSSKHRLQLLEHFDACISSAKGATRTQAVQVNIFAAFLSGLKKMAELKLSIGNKKVKAAAQRLVLSALHNPDAIVRCAAGEAMGRLAQVAGEAFVSEAIQALVEHVQTECAAESRTGNSLAIGCILRYAGSVTAAQHLSITTKLLHALSNDSNSDVQTWALHALMLAIDSTGFDFHPYVGQTLQLCSDILHRDSTPSVLRSAGNVVNALITTLGPEVQTQERLRRKLQYMLHNLQQSQWPSVQLAGLHGMQKLILFAPAFVRIPEFMPVLKDKLLSQHSLLRHAATAILKQLIQRDAKSVHESGDGIEKTLFRMLDSEEDPALRTAIRDCIHGFVSSLGHVNPSHWLLISNGVLSGATEKEDEAAADQQRQRQRTQEPLDKMESGEGDQDDEEDAGTDDIDARMKVTSTVRTVLPTTWQTKVFAVECVQQLMAVCKEAFSAGENPHFDVVAAKAAGGDRLILKLAEVIRTCFIAATSTTDQLKKAGLEALDVIIRFFADSKDPDVDGDHSILEQYQAQVTSALRPAFSEDTAPSVKHTACMVCASWIASGVNTDVGDLKRLMGLLAKPLATAKADPDSGYNERASTMLRLGILQAWAIIYNRAAEAADMQHLLGCLKEYMPQLTQYWTEALHDYALVSLPPEYSSQIPVSGNFYFAGTRATVVEFYQDAYPDIMKASASLYKTVDDAGGQMFFLQLGLCARAITSTSTTPALVLASLQALSSLLVNGAQLLANEDALVVELASILHHGLRAYGLSGESWSSIAIGVLRAFKALASSNGETAPIALCPAHVEFESANCPMFLALQSCTTVLLQVYPGLATTLNAEALASATSLQSQSHFSQQASSLQDDQQELVRVSAECLCALCMASPPAMMDKVLNTALLILIELLAITQTSLTAALTKLLQGLVAELVKSQAALPFLLSACRQLLERAETSDHNTSALLLAAVLVITQCDECARHTSIQKLACEALRKALNSEVASTRATAAKISIRLCTLKPEMGVGPSYVADIGCDLVQAVAAAARTKPTCTEDVEVVRQGVACLEATLNQADDESKPQVMAVVVSVLIPLLTGGAPSTIEGAISQLALDSLKRIGPLYPTAFRQVFTEAPQLKMKLETAMKESMAQAQQQATRTSTAQVAPKIKLTMDFSAFK